MLKVLVNAYACSPNMGSEPGMAWNWCANLAKHCELFVITEEEFRDKIETVVPTLPQGGNMHFYFNPVTPEVRKMCWNQGDWRFYWHYRKWQKRTLEIAKQICAEQKIDILHQLNMIGYREPGLLWKIKGPKFVWGPVGGMETMPIAYLKGAGVKTVLFNRLKNSINSLQYRYQPNVRRAVARADAIIAATSGCQKKLQDFYGKKVHLINETGCEVIENVERSENAIRKMNLLWVGKLDFRKQINLAIDVLGQFGDLDIELHVCGGGTEEQIAQMKQQADRLGVRDKLNYHGMISHDKVQHLMRTSDLFLFTSIMEGTPHVVQEAIANHLPVICLDTCGQGDCVSDKVGHKVELSTPEQTVEEMAGIIRELYQDRQRLQRLSDNCLAVSKEMSWDNKVSAMMDAYKNAPPTCSRLNIIWVGKFDFRKQLGLAIKTIAELRDMDVMLHVVGSGDNEKYKAFVNKLGIGEKVLWHGQVSHEQVNNLMRQSDLFFFTSIMDATSTVVMEAIQNHLPVVCFDTCGFGTVVDETIGLSIPLTNPEKSVKDFAEAICGLYEDRRKLSLLSTNCKERIKLFEWDYKAQMMVDIYKRIAS